VSCSGHVYIVAEKTFKPQDYGKEELEGRGGKGVEEGNGRGWGEE